MKVTLNFNKKTKQGADLVITSAFSKAKGKSNVLDNTHWNAELKSSFKSLSIAKNFNGGKGETLVLPGVNNSTLLVVGLGERKDLDAETLRREVSKAFKSFESKCSKIEVDLDAFAVSIDASTSAHAITESVFLSEYKFLKHKSVQSKPILKEVAIVSTETAKKEQTKIKESVKNAQNIAESVNFGRDLINEAPNVLHSEEFAKVVEKDAKVLKRVKVKTLNKTQIKKEKMGLFLSVNAASSKEPRLVHLTYTPAKVTKKTKHIALVGKGLTFDTGGYSLKPGSSMVGMKTDMGGAATVYAAFRAAVLLNSENKISCLIGMTDNAVSNNATMPDSVVKARNGKTVEILNTDAEGRLVLADVLDYACDQKPDAIIDCATLTGAVLVALGHEICGVMGNNQNLTDALLSSANKANEHMWQLPIIPEFRKDMRSNIADLKNIGGSRFGGSAKAAAFLENFVKNDIPWAHLDVAGIAGDQGHLPYCPSKGASGLIVRSLTNYLTNV